MLVYTPGPPPVIPPFAKRSHFSNDPLASLKLPTRDQSSNFIFEVDFVKNSSEWMTMAGPSVFVRTLNIYPKEEVVSPPTDNRSCEPVVIYCIKARLGSDEGISLGSEVGKGVLGSILGNELGSAMGAPVGAFVGAKVVGLAVGVLVGLLVKSLATKASIPSTL
jgi:hypothetical protein